LSAPDPQATFDAILARAGRAGELPGFARSIKTILATLAEDDSSDSDARLVQLVLCDAALTQKVLKLANSAMYAMFEGEVVTVSHAVRLLGLHTVGHLALGLKVIESFEAAGASGSAHQAATRAEMEKAALAGQVGRQLAAGASLRDGEAAGVCSILQGLGRMLVAFHLPERWARVQQRIEAGEEEAAAAVAELGAELEQFGAWMAQRWGLPASLTHAMTAQTPSAPERAASHEEWLRVLATAANRSAQALHDSNEERASARLEQVAQQFSATLGLEPTQLAQAARTAHEVSRAGALPAAPAPRETSFADKLRLRTKELRTALEQGASTLALMTQALEVINASLGGSRAVLFVRQAKDQRYCAHVGLGERAQSQLAAMVFDDRYQPEVFHVALGADRVTYLEDAQALRERFAPWWQRTLGDATRVCLVPLQVGTRALALLYVDWAGDVAKLDAEALGQVGQVRELLIGHMTRSLGVARAAATAGAKQAVAA
jgi:HD-like signal output (HDOD) protein